MLSPSLHLRRQPGRLILAFSPAYRTAFAAMTLLFLAIAFIGGPPPSPAAVLMALLCLLAALYQEQWTADAGNQTLEARLGLLWPYRRHTYPFSTLASWNLRFVMRGDLSRDPHQKRGIHKRALLRLEAHLRDGDILVLEIKKEDQREALIRQGEALAEITGSPFNREI